MGHRGGRSAHLLFPLLDGGRAGVPGRSTAAVESPPLRRRAVACELPGRRLLPPQLAALAALRPDVAGDGADAALERRASSDVGRAGDLHPGAALADVGGRGGAGRIALRGQRLSWRADRAPQSIAGAGVAAVRPAARRPPQRPPRLARAALRRGDGDDPAGRPHPDRLHRGHRGDGLAAGHGLGAR